MPTGTVKSREVRRRSERRPSPAAWPQSAQPLRAFRTQTSFCVVWRQRVVPGKYRDAVASGHSASAKVKVTSSLNPATIGASVRFTATLSGQFGGKPNRHGILLAKWNRIGSAGKGQARIDGQRLFRHLFNAGHLSVKGFIPATRISQPVPQPL